MHILLKISGIFCALEIIKRMFGNGAVYAFKWFKWVIQFFVNVFFFSSLESFKSSKGVFRCCVIAMEYYFVDSLMSFSSITNMIPFSLSEPFEMSIKEQMIFENANRCQSKAKVFFPFLMFNDDLHFFPDRPTILPANQ